jgi:hypothetical protein
VRRFGRSWKRISRAEGGPLCAARDDGLGNVVIVRRTARFSLRDILESADRLRVITSGCTCHARCAGAQVNRSALESDNTEHRRPVVANLGRTDLSNDI